MLREFRLRPGFSYVHVVGFEETNVVGNVYFARHVAWQGRCRELFLRERVPEILTDLSASLRLVTLKVTCEYFEEVRPFDTVQVVMFLGYVDQNRVGLDFEYRRIAGERHDVVAVGFQEVACMRATASGLVPAALPVALEEALRGYEGTTGDPSV